MSCIPLLYCFNWIVVSRPIRFAVVAYNEIVTRVDSAIANQFGVLVAAEVAEDWLRCSGQRAGLDHLGLWIVVGH